jgi:PD-(D/E)XK nuclease superfamily
MTYSYTQISQYLRCPRSYRFRYLDGWREKDTRATMVFGRCFETALGAYFRGEDSTAVLFKEWGAFRDSPFEYRETPGIAWSIRESTCSRNSHRMIAFRFSDLNKTYK